MSSYKKMKKKARSFSRFIDYYIKLNSQKKHDDMMMIWSEIASQFFPIIFQCWSKSISRKDVSINPAPSLLFLKKRSSIIRWRLYTMTMMMMISVWRNMREEAQKKNTKKNKCWNMMWPYFDVKNYWPWTKEKNERHWNRNENKTNKKNVTKIIRFQKCITKETNYFSLSILFSCFIKTHNIYNNINCSIWVATRAFSYPHPTHSI